MTYNRLKITLLLFLLPALFIKAQATPFDDLLTQGRAEMLAFRLEKAEETLKLALKKPEGTQGTAAIYYHLSTISCWKAFFEQTDSKRQSFQIDTEAFLQAIRLETDPKWQQYFRAELHFQRTLLLFQQGKINDAAFEAKKAYDNYEAVIEKYPDFADAYKGFGMLKMAIGSMPRSYRWLLNILGYSGNTKEGLLFMKKAATESTFSKEEAQIYYAVADMSMNEMMDGAVELLPALYQKFPQSPLMMAVYGFSLIQQQQTEKALEVLAQKSAADVYRPALIDYFTAESLFRLNRFEASVIAYQDFLNGFEGNLYKSNALLRLGFALEMIDKRADALAIYQKIQTDSDFDADKMAKRMANYRLQSSFLPQEKQLLRAQNAFDSGNWTLALELAEAVLQDTSASLLQQTEAAYRKGRALQKSGEKQLAIVAYQQSVENPADAQAKFAPWSQYYIGECYEELGDNANARRAYRKSLAFGGNFDYHKSLEQRAQAALSRL